MRSGRPYVPRIPAPGEVRRVYLEDLEESNRRLNPDGTPRQTPKA